VKGQVEDACQKLDFPRYSIFRPGLLLTEREESRPLEWVLQKIYPNWMLPALAKAVETKRVAEAMVLNTVRAPAGAVEMYNNDAIYLLKVGAENAQKH